MVCNLRSWALAIVQDDMRSAMADLLRGSQHVSWFPGQAAMHVSMQHIDFSGPEWRPYSRTACSQSHDCWPLCHCRAVIIQQLHLCT